MQSDLSDKECFKKVLNILCAFVLNLNSVSLFMKYFSCLSLTVALIQVYMGDRKGKGTQLSSAQEIIIKGWHCVALRDEIYMQLCKQTTDNPKL